MLRKRFIIETINESFFKHYFDGFHPKLGFRKTLCGVCQLRYCAPERHNPF